MIPIPTQAKNRLLLWLPKRLAGRDYPLIETDRIEPDLSAPAITFYFQSAGKTTLYQNTLIRAIRREDGSLDDYWGQYHTATMTVVLRELDRDRLEAMWVDFLKQLQLTRRNLLLRLDGVRFVDVLNSVQLRPERLPSGKTLYWAQVDLEIEHEMSAISDAELIKRAKFTDRIGGEDSESILILEKEYVK